MIRFILSFLRTEAASGVVLLLATIAALMVANSFWAGDYFAILKQPLTLPFINLTLDLGHWIKDGLMAMFFLLVGLEIKRELMDGELSTLRKAALPFFAALGGMAAPAAIYLAITWNYPELHSGWAIPAATDIAFAVGALTIISKRVPLTLKIFLLALAIIDDIGAVLIIAVFYASELNTGALWTVAGLFGLLLTLNRLGVARAWPYLLLGLPLWYAMHESGVHATLAGILLAAAIPLRPFSPKQKDSPALRLEHALLPWVAFGIMPVFAFSAAGVPLGNLDLAMLAAPVTLGVMLGLLLGKPMGIFISSWLAIRCKLAAMPEDCRWMHLLGAGCLGGIGFTMSLFIAALGFSGDLEMAARLGILAGSLASALAGLTILALCPPNPPPAQSTTRRSA